MQPRAYSFVLLSLLLAAPLHAAENTVLPPMLPGDTGTSALEKQAPSAGDSNDPFQGTTLPAEMPVADAGDVKNFDFPALPPQANIVKSAQKIAKPDMGTEEVWKKEIQQAIQHKTEGEVPAIQSLRYNRQMALLSQSTGWHAQDVVVNPQNNQFTGRLVSPGQPDVMFRGLYQAQRLMPVLKERLARGTVITQSDIEMRPIAERRIRPDTYILAADQLFGKALNRAVAPGQPLRKRDVLLPVAVLAKSEISMIYQTDSLAVTDLGIAQESGSIGDVIRVKNTKSGTLLRALVEGPQRVRVNYIDAGAKPVNQPIVAQAGGNHALNN